MTLSFLEDQPLNQPSSTQEQTLIFSVTVLHYKSILAHFDLSFLRDRRHCSSCSEKGEESKQKGKYNDRKKMSIT
jgi:hypothetical protein